LTSFNGDFYDENYFENGRKTGKSWYENYHWMPRKTFREAFAYIDALGLDEKSKVLDFGCSKGYMVKALRLLDIDTMGCDISKYALKFSPYGCWNCSEEREWKNHEGSGYTHIIAKDTFEHLNPDQLHEILCKLGKLAKKMMCVVPMGDRGVYNIPEYHLDKSHIIAENDYWWSLAFGKAGWLIVDHANHLNGLKDNWAYCQNGNHVFVLEYCGK
jgi:SAM-dependent methyltransferase